MSEIFSKYYLYVAAVMAGVQAPMLRHFRCSCIGNKACLFLFVFLFVVFVCLVGFFCFLFLCLVVLRHCRCSCIGNKPGNWGIGGGRGRAHHFFIPISTKKRVHFLF